MRVSQVLGAAGRYDAVTNQALRWRERFRAWGWEGEDYTAVVAPNMPGGLVRELSALRPAADEVLLVHYSGYAPAFETLLDGRRRTMLVSHNVTPASFFWEESPTDAVRCEQGRWQLGQLARTAELLVGVSEFNARELRELSGREAAVVPVLLSEMETARAQAPAQRPAGQPRLLFVGRLVPHKRQDLLIAVLARFRELTGGGRLRLIGLPLSPAYGARLESLAENLVPGAVRFEQDITPAALSAAYGEADVFVCLSEHEGFCIPLVEALGAGVPVVARDAGAVAEVLDGAGVLLSPGDDVETAAQLLRIVVEDDELRGELRERGRRRVRDFDPDAAAARMRTLIEGLAA